MFALLLLAAAAQPFGSAHAGDPPIIARDRDGTFVIGRAIEADPARLDAEAEILFAEIAEDPTTADGLAVSASRQRRLHAEKRRAERAYEEAADMARGAEGR